MAGMACGLVAYAGLKLAWDSPDGINTV